MLQKNRINFQITAPELRVIGEDGAQLGVLKTADALKIAQEQGFDLIEVAPLAKPPVAKLMDVAKYRYQQKKAEAAAKKNAKKTELRTIRLSMRISDHDKKIKAAKVDEFLESGDMVKLELRMRGREQAFAEQGRDNIRGFLAHITHPHKIQEEPRRMGNTWSAMLVPGKAAPAPHK